jgi:hypothetical protein
MEIVHIGATQFGTYDGSNLVQVCFFFLKIINSMQMASFFKGRFGSQKRFLLSRE